MAGAGTVLQLSDGRQLVQLTPDDGPIQRYALRSIDGKHLGYLTVEDVELSHTLAEQLLQSRKRSP